MLHLIQPYDPRWKSAFEQLRQVLADALSGMEVDIQHVGSTSIPDLCAKPIIDIDIIILSPSLLLAVSSILEKLGYIAKGEQGIPGRFAFRQSSTKVPIQNDFHAWQEHHLYVCYADSVAVKNHLLFRDALWKNATLVKEYASLKERLLQEKGMTRERYNRLKTDFILAVLASAGMNENELHSIRKQNE
ncbi:MAG: GrpB family protein [Bacteroidetes bacterium]|nr:GrpB family protein [Bacteroidota bacterium]